MRSQSPSKGAVTTRKITRPREELEAEHSDPYVQGWEAGVDLDDPPPCPYKDGTSAKLWRSGFSARVDDYIATIRKQSGLHTNLSAPV